MTDTKIRHSENVGAVTEVAVLDSLPKRPSNGAAPGRGREPNPFDAGVGASYVDGKPRLVIADDLESAKVLIRRAAEHQGLGVDVVPTEHDGRPALAYLARAKRERSEGQTHVTATGSSAPATDDTDFDDYDDGEPVSG